MFFAIAGAVFDGLALLFTGLEVRDRLAARHAYAQAVRDAQPWLDWNLHRPTREAIRAVKGEEELDDMLEGQNQLGQAIRDAERRLAGLSDAGGKDWRLWLGLTFLALGLACGAVSNILGAR